ncbi:MAG: hypothetical protein ACFCU1_03705 [Sumerlaeia bacterium]
MAKRSPASKRASTKSSPIRNMVLVGSGIFAVGLLCGYAMRSYTPVPFFPDERLSPQAIGTAKAKSATEKKINALEETLDELDEKREKTEAELGETKIKAILGNS